MKIFVSEESVYRCAPQMRCIQENGLSDGKGGGEAKRQGESVVLDILN